MRTIYGPRKWQQQKSAKFEDAPGKSNPADMMTNGFAQAWTKKHVEFIVAAYAHGRAEGASQVATDEVDREEPLLGLQHA